MAVINRQPLINKQKDVNISPVELSNPAIPIAIRKYKQNNASAKFGFTKCRFDFIQSKNEQCLYKEKSNYLL